jgi:tetratricopeptide (TPR) repeat protein/DNA-directed RNA polymerase subunit RPC12/RpoP
MSIEVISLKCSKCGAPLPKPEKDSEYVKCEFCGVLQKIVEATSYTEKLKTEVFKWMKEFMPVSMEAIQTVDVLARHNIFIAYIKPKIIPEYSQIKSRILKILSSPLLILSGIKVNVTADDPKESFEKLAKIESISSMAVVTDDQEFYKEVYSIYVLNAYLNNYIKMGLSGDIDYAIKNLEELTNILTNIGKVSSLNMRIKSLASALKAWRYLKEGDFTSAITFLEEALKFNREVREMAIKDPQLSIMITAIDTEATLIKSLSNYAEVEKALFETGHQPQELMSFLGKYLKVIENIREMYNKSLLLHYEMSEKIKAIYMSKLGKGTVDILPGQGDILVPMYLVRISYTFTTGSLLWKKGKEFKDYILILGTYPYSTIPVTDTFRLKSGFLDRMRGREEKLTIDTVTNAIAVARRDYITIPVIPPVSDSEMAKKVADAYLAEVSKRLGGKISMGASVVEKIVYCPARIVNNDIYIDSLSEVQVSLGKYLSDLVNMACR